MDYIIYQITKEEFKRGEIDLQFKGYKWFERYCGNVDFNLTKLGYEQVYIGKIESTDIQKSLNELFRKFNIELPENYKGRSLSVSDVVKIGNEYYYCDSIGWKQLENVVF